MEGADRVGKSGGKSYLLYKSPMLRAWASVRGTRVKVDACGPLAHLPPIKSALRMFDGQLPAYADSEKLCLSTWAPPISGRAFSRLADSRLRALLGRRTPDQVTISITEECPNRCAHCALPNSGNKLCLSSRTVKDIICQILDMGTTLVIFDGGEPALYRELLDLVASVDDRAISTLFTSGAGFTATLARRLKEAGLYAVNVSLDSPIEAEHDAMRGREGVFSEAMQTVRFARQAGLLVDLYVVLRRENMSHLQGFHELARRMGAHELTFFEVVCWYRPLVGAAEHRSHAGRSRPTCGFCPKRRSTPHIHRGLQDGCFAATSWMHITPAGEVYPCPCYPESWGSIFAEPIKKIWRRTGSFPYKKSKVCPMRK